jgi:hypothetical protein
MPQTQIRGSTQIKDLSIPASKFVASLNLPTSQLQDGALFIKSDGSVPMAAALPMGNFKITGLATPTAGTDAATKAYVDSIASGLDPKGSVRLVSTGNVAITGLLTIDSVTLVAGDRVLLTAQTTTTQNGMWVAAAGAWTRPTDYAAASVQASAGGIHTFVEEGTVFGDTGWVCTTNGAVTVDVTATAWSQFTGVGSLTAGNGITKTGNSIAVTNGGTAAQVYLAGTGGTTGLPVWSTLSGDATIAAGGALTVAATIAQYANFVVAEVPTGAVNGVNAAFTLAFAPKAGTVKVYLNGLRQLIGAANSYTIAGSVITFVTAPSTGDELFVDYIK